MTPVTPLAESFGTAAAMSEPTTAAELAQLAVRMQLLSESFSRELLYEFDNNNGPPADFAKHLERKGLLTPFQSTKLLKGDGDGYLLGGYRILYRVASGSFGRVYRGDDPRSGNIVAVKVLRRRYLDTPKRIESFEREGRLGMSLDHPNIVRILNVGKDDSTGGYFIVMDFVEGGNLRDILQIRKTFELQEALRILEECVVGLAYAFSRGLTHRDIKPSNILLGTDKIAKLVDFGLAEVNAVQQTMIVGVKQTNERAERTVDYAGLEKATNVPSGDIRSDIYFLGHVLFEMIAGEPVLPPTKNAQTRMSQRRFEEVEPAVERLGRKHQFPYSVQKLLQKAMALEPTQRYQQPTAFLEGIKAVRAELAGNIGRVSSGRRAAGPLTVFVVEPKPKLQDVFRTSLKEYGFQRVLISIDVGQAIKRYQQQPYHAAILDAGAVGKEAIDAFKRLVNEANSLKLDCCVVLILNVEQRHWVDDALAAGGGEVMVRPLTLSTLYEVLSENIDEVLRDVEASHHDAND